MLEKSGVDITTFKCQSTPSAVASKSFLSGIPIHQILEAASWSNVKTFTEFYNKPIVDKLCFSNDLLETVYVVCKFRIFYTPVFTIHNLHASVLFQSLYNLHFAWTLADKPSFKSHVITLLHSVCMRENPKLNELTL